MTPRFKIEREKSNYKYMIKRRYSLIFYDIMYKNEFFGGLSEYGDYNLSREEALFKSVDDAMDALHKYAKINAIEKVIVKIGEV